MNDENDLKTSNELIRIITMNYTKFDEKTLNEHLWALKSVIKEELLTEVRKQIKAVDIFYRWCDEKSN